MICVSISGLSACEILAEIKELPMVELRLDLLEVSPSDIEKICRAHHNLIVTCRPGKLSRMERKERLSIAISSGAAYVDIEYEAEKEWKSEIAALAHQHGVKVILSSHNFEITPDDAELNLLIKAMQAEEPALVKLACQANSTQDSARLLSLYETHSNLIAIGMGPLGIVTRVAAPFLGAPFTFAAGSAGATAAGQLTYPEMQRIFQIMNKGE